MSPSPSPAQAHDVQVVGPHSQSTTRRKPTQEKSRVSGLARTLRLRLRYAKLKVDRGWTRQTISEVENLHYRAMRAANIPTPQPITIGKKITEPLNSSKVGLPERPGRVRTPSHTKNNDYDNDDDDENNNVSSSPTVFESPLQAESERTTATATTTTTTTTTTAAAAAYATSPSERMKTSTSVGMSGNLASSHNIHNTFTSPSTRVTTVTSTPSTTAHVQISPIRPNSIYATSTAGSSISSSGGGGGGGSAGGGSATGPRTYEDFWASLKASPRSPSKSRISTSGILAPAAHVHPENTNKSSVTGSDEENRERQVKVPRKGQEDLETVGGDISLRDIESLDTL